MKHIKIILEPYGTHLVMNKLCPENLQKKFQQRSHYAKYDTRFSKNHQIRGKLAIFSAWAQFDQTGPRIVENVNQ